jgi:hypothetical protein
VQVLLRLGHLLGDLECLGAAERALVGAYGRIAQYPSAHGSLLIALAEYLRPPQTVVVRGTPEALQDWQAQLLRRYAPQRMVLAIPTEAGALPGALAERKNISATTAYVCSGHTCRPPVTDLGALEQLLAQGEAPPA